MADCTATQDMWHDTHCALAKTLLGKRVLPKTYASLVRAAHVEKVAADTVIWQEGMDLPGLAVLCSGYLRVSRYGQEGRRQIVNLFVPGDLVGQDIHAEMGVALESATDAVLYWFDRRTYQELQRADRLLRLEFYRNTIMQVERLRWLTWIVGALKPEERLAAFLLNAVRFMPFKWLDKSNGRLTLTVSRRDIADLLATTPETICRTLKAFRREGLINMVDPLHVVVRDRPGLVKRAALTRDPAALAGVNEPYCVPCQIEHMSNAKPTHCVPAAGEPELA